MLYRSETMGRHTQGWQTQVQGTFSALTVAGMGRPRLCQVLRLCSMLRALCEQSSPPVSCERRSSHHPCGRPEYAA